MCAPVPIVHALWDPHNENPELMEHVPCTSHAYTTKIIKNYGACTVGMHTCDTPLMVHLIWEVHCYTPAFIVNLLCKFLKVSQNS